MKRQVKTPRVKDKKGRFVTKSEAAKKGYEAYQLEQTLIKECKALDIELSEGYTLTELFHGSETSTTPRQDTKNDRPLYATSFEQYFRT